MQSESAAEAATNEETVTAEAESGGLETLAELLSADSTPEGDGEAGDTGDTEGEAAGNGEKASLEKFNDLAEALEVELDDLYKLELSTNDGESVSIQDLKNTYTKSEELTLRELELEETRAKQEGELRQSQAELTEIIAMLPEGTIKKNVLEKIRAKHGAMVQQERQKTLEVIPTWQDEKTREADLSGMAKHLESYGFPASYLGQVVDHRQLNYIRESYLREKRIREALDKVKAGKPNPTPRSKATGAPPRRAAKKVTPKGGQTVLQAMFEDL